MNEKNILDDIMYNPDGSFRPFLGHHGNISGEVADYRNTYMEAEKEYFSYLLADEKIRSYIAELLYNCSPDDLFAEAIKIQERLETGNLESEQEKKQMQLMTPDEREQYHFKKLLYAEGIMCILFSAIRDKAMLLDEIQCWENRFSQIENSTRGLR